MSRTYVARKWYIDNLRTLLEAREDFKDLTYHRNSTSNEEFLFLSTLDGITYMLNVTGYTDAQIFHVMAMIDCGQKPKCLIEDRAKRMELGKLFNQ